MTNLITPPPELVRQWWNDFNGAFYEFEAITAKVFQAGADTEQEACCDALDGINPSKYWSQRLRAARRPTPPSLKEQALACCNDYIDPDGIIRRALEQLND